MNIQTLSLVVIILHSCCPNTVYAPEPHNVTDWSKSRQKRFLIYTTSGVHKFVSSLSLPIDLYDKKPWRSFTGAWNFQWQHFLPTTIQYWWNSSYWPQSGRRRSIGEAYLPTIPAQKPVDLTATFLYALIETFMNNNGMNGKECLQRSICENAQIHYVGGILDRIFQRLLTPEPSMEDYYKDSYRSGTKGVDCYKTFSGCPKGQSIFDQFVQVQELK